MSSTSLSAPVGLSPRTSEGDPVQNNANDVKLVRAMLRANGMPSKDTGSVDGDLLKLIEAMQKKAGVRPIDQVVDPGGVTFKKMLPAYEKEIAELGTGDRVVVTYKNKKICISKADYDKVEKATADQLTKYVDIIEKSLSHNKKICEDWKKKVGGAEGFINQLSSLLVLGVGRVTLPDLALAKSASTAISAARSSVSSRDFKGVARTLPAAEKAVNAVTKDMLRFLSEVGASAKSVHATLQLTTSVGWMVVGAMATPVLIGAGMGAGGAAIVGSAGVSLLQSGANELGRHATGQDVTIGGSVARMAVDMFVGGALGKVSTLKPAFVTKIAKALTPALAREVEGYVAKEVAEKFIQRYLTTTGNSLATGICSDVLNTAKESIKSGKVPSEKEVTDKIIKRLQDTLTAGIFGEMGRFQTAWVHKKKPEVITKKLFPEVMKSSKFKKTELTERQRRDLEAAVLKGMTKTGANTVIDKVIGSAKGNETQSKLLADAEKTMLSDSKVRSEVEKLIEAELKKMKVPA